MWLRYNEDLDKAIYLYETLPRMWLRDSEHLDEAIHSHAWRGALVLEFKLV